jgi:1,6-anhydro-N-acetylmuramate kinase
MVLDHLARRLLGAARDDGGRTAARGTIDTERLAATLADPYFAWPAPKSTGRERFGAAFVERHFGPFEGLDPDEVAERFATAAALTVESVARAIEGAAGTPRVPGDAEVIVAGGGRPHRSSHGRPDRGAGAGRRVQGGGRFRDPGLRERPGEMRQPAVGDGRPTPGAVWQADLSAARRSFDT